jgi:hypothetical protein
MTRTLIVGAALVLASHMTSAQMPGAAAKAAAQKAAAATNEHIAAEQRTDEPQKPAAKPVPTKPVPASQVASAPTKGAPNSSTHPGTAVSVASGDLAGPPPTILREAYDYGKDGRRDPFVSLLTTNDLRPAMSDLRLTGILFDHTGRRSVATLRDLTTNAQYRVTIGSTLGRMRIAAIRLKTVLFTIDEFGTTRQDSLVLGDSTKARGK